MTSKDQIAHDLAMVYLSNRYGPEVTGTFSVSTWQKDVTGSGDVETKRLPGVNEIRTAKVGTGEKHFFGLVEKKISVDAGFEIDQTFEMMIAEYFEAKTRILKLLQ
jgi:hypothetical protein